MTYIIAQIFGVLTTICCLIGPLFQKKWQMLVNCMIATLCNIINFLMLGGAFSGTIVNLVALVQLFFALWHVLKETRVTVYENVLFFIAYLVLGFMGYRNMIDILPVLGAIAYMFAIFQRNEQKPVSSVLSTQESGLYMI